MGKIERYILYICLGMCIGNLFIQHKFIHSVYDLFESSIKVQSKVIKVNNSIVNWINGTCEGIENDK